MCVGLVGGNLGNMQMLINGPFFFYVGSWCQQSVTYNFIPSCFSVAGGGRGEGGVRERGGPSFATRIIFRNT